jgi:Na+/H+-dicarboxylate symporter
MGMGIALLFRPLFRLDKVYVSAPTNAVGFTCPNNNLLQMLPNSTIACVGNVTELGGIVDTVAFEIADVNSVFEKNVKNALARMSVSDQILSILNLIVPKNIFLSLSNADVLSTITFAMVFGAIAGRNYFTKTRKVNYLYLVLLQLRNTFFLAMEWVIWLTPMAVVSIIAGSFATNQTAVKQFGDVYMYVVAIICAMVLQVFVTLPFLIFLLTRCNPYHHMKFMKEAYVFAFGSASSLATAPVTLSCVKKARVCSQSLANFVISIGVCSNTSGNGFYHPIAMVFLAESSGNGSELTALRLLAIYLLAIFACAGTPPIPSGGIVLMATVYKTVFGVSDTPATFPLFIAMDFFVDRLITICNVNDDIMALKVIAENTDETIVGDHLGERE